MAASAWCGDAEEPSLVWVAVRYRVALVAIALAAGSLLPAYDTSTPLLYPPPEPRYGNEPRLGLTALSPAATAPLLRGAELADESRPREVI